MQGATERIESLVTRLGYYACVEMGDRWWQRSKKLQRHTYVLLSRALWRFLIARASDAEGG